MLGNYPNVRKTMINGLFRHASWCFMLNLEDTKICKKIPPKSLKILVNFHIDQIILKR